MGHMLRFYQSERGTVYAACRKRGAFGNARRGGLAKRCPDGQQQWHANARKLANGKHPANRQSMQVLTIPGTDLPFEEEAHASPAQRRIMALRERIRRRQDPAE